MQLNRYISTLYYQRVHGLFTYSFYNIIKAMIILFITNGIII